MSSSADDSQTRTRKKKKRNGKVGKVFPLTNVAVDKGSDHEKLVDQKLLDQETKGEEEEVKMSVHNVAADVVSLYRNVKKGVERFKHLRCGRRTILTGTSGIKKNTLVKGIDASISPEPLSPNVANAELIGYFGHLATSEDPSVKIDLEYLELILNRGANINCTDKYGQTALHEVARTWDPDIAVFIILKGADVNQADMFGRTPLHIAAAVDFPEMIAVLLDNGANIESLTEGEKQTPLHYAARNDACNALRLLLKKGAKMHERDYKGRTPLLVAAELDRSETAHLLLELGARACDMDRTGHTALQIMVNKMPAVAKEGLNQLYRYDRANRKQYYDLHLLEPLPVDESVEVPARTVLQNIVMYNQLDLIMHPVCRQLVEVKWDKFGKRGAIKQMIFNLIFILMWSILGVSLENPFEYSFPEDIWRLVLEICGVALTVYQIALELKEFNDSKNLFMSWKNWRINDIERDFKYCHPRWPQERQYLNQEITEIKEQGPVYFSDSWNLFDWFVYISLLLVSILHVVDIFVDASGLSDATQNIFACILIFVWLRLMKTMRAFRTFGPFIVMLALIAKDFGIFIYLYSNFYVPYACAFWMTYGGRNSTVPSMQTVDQMMYSLFRITLVDEYDYDGMRQENVVMTYILLVTFLMISAILCINVLIALLSNTFQRVYDNATAIALMQQTSIILNIEEGLNKSRRRKYHQYIREVCSPQTLYYDDDMTSEGAEDLRKMTFKIKDSLQELDDYIREDQHKNHTGSIKEVKAEIEELRHLHQRAMKKVHNDLKVTQELLKAVLEQMAGGKGGGTGGGGRGVVLPPITQQPDDDEEERQGAATPRFVGRREKRSSLPSLFGDDNVDDTMRSTREPPYLTSPRPDTTGDDKQRIKVYRNESKRQRKLRQQREEYLQQRLRGEESMADPGPSGQRSKGETQDGLESRGQDVDEEAPPESLADLVRLQSSVLFDTEMSEDTTKC
ncbi:uncharacterized protein [Diadema setosum]|uniref:uncharacterized protein n=1 Tax=Diadema setosum TaxID=31175 RepID=UPI003B3BC6DF